MMRGAPLLAVMHLQAGGCGGCGLELDLVAMAPLGLVPTSEPRHADVLLVSGAPGRAMMQAVAAAWTAMAAPKHLVAIGDCAIEGGPFRGGYAIEGGLTGRLPLALAIAGSPPSPEAIRDGLAGLLEAIGGAVREGEMPADAAPAPVPDPARQALLPAAPRHRLSGDGSSDS